MAADLTSAPERPAARAAAAREKSEAQLGVDAAQASTTGPGPARRGFGIGSLLVVAGVLIWLLLRVVLAGRFTLPLDQQDTVTVHENLNTWPEWVSENQDTNPLFRYFLDGIRVVLENTGTFLQTVFFQTQVGRGLPQIGWLGTTVLVTVVAWVVGNAKVALLTAASFLLFVLQGLWPDAMATLSLVLAAVFFSFLIGLPLGIWAGVDDRVSRIVTPVLDFMQIMPAFAYLAPLVLIFGLGPASAVAATLVFAVPPVIRITAHGLRQVPATTREAADSLGVTGAQRLRTVLLPMAKRTIVIGINQTFMAALAMVTIASFIGAAGLGLDVNQALQGLDVGAGFNAGLAIVLMAIVFDRVTTAASVRAELAARRGRDRRTLRWVLIGVGVVVAAVAIQLSRTYLWAAEAPGSWWDWGTPLENAVNTAAGWLQTHFSLLTLSLRDGFTTAILNPFQSLLQDAPWFAVGILATALGGAAGGWRIALTAALGTGAVLGLGVWSDAMASLAATLVAAVLTMVVAVAVGVWMGRSTAADRVIRPVLDAAQTLPAFVYLVPFLGLFGSSRFTAIVAALVYAAPPAIKIIADGVAQVPADTVEAARSSGSTSWQLITRVQLPMSVKAIALAGNQAVIYTLSMVVIGGAVGAQALGYNVISGLDKQTEFFGKGLASGLTLVVLGIVLDRITQAAAQRSGVRARRSAERVTRRARPDTVPVAPA